MRVAYAARRFPAPMAALRPCGAVALHQVVTGNVTLVTRQSDPTERPESGDVKSIADRGLEMLDAHAKAAYRRRLAELRAELEEAEAFHDAGRTARAPAEMEAISEQLAGAVGLGGRDRRAASASERARSPVTKRIAEALKRIAEASPALADQLRGRVRIGTFCVYVPDAAHQLAWEL